MTSKKPHPVRILSESPFLIRISLTSLPLGTLRSSRSLKRKSYAVSSSSSDENEASFSDTEPLNNKRPRPLSSHTTTTTTTTKAPLPQSAPLYASSAIDAPPPGVLPSLWYSRECVLHVHVIEKIWGWKRRDAIRLDHGEDIPLTKLGNLSTRIANEATRRRDVRRRMEVSRINPAQCPAVLKAAEVELGRELRLVKGEREQVLLVKWRGQSYGHCSWERPQDLEKFDPSNNTAKGKIKRFFQQKEMELGREWRKVLEVNAKDDCDEEEDKFPPEWLEVERILACDESELDLRVLTKQKDINKNTIEIPKSEPFKLPPEEPWDPEDNVRYVVKWKGLQNEHMTWEYWRDIKHDFVDPVEDFWRRQQCPPQAEIDRVLHWNHPHVRDFKKLQKSPIFGVSSGTPQTTNDDEDKLGLRLRPYQLEGVNWLLWNWWNRRSCILADEMGLGKTIQSVCFLDQLMRLPNTNIRGPFLVVAPLSLISQWQSESTAWAPDMNVIVYHGSADARDFLVREEFYFTDQFCSKGQASKLKRQSITKFQLLITTYEVVLKDIAVLSKIRWRALIVDEAHRLKNPKSRFFLELATVPRDFCLLLTGTPLQNSTEELWALLHFSDPQNFASKEEFVSKFGQLTDSQQVRDLHSVLKPYLLRRVKEDVEKSLPPKEETILEVTLTPIQKTYYKAIYERNTSFLFKGAKPSNAPSLMNIMMELRKCCNHPFLIRGAEERILNDAATSRPHNLGHAATFKEQLVKSSGKMVLLTKLLPKLHAGGHKVLIFSQMVRVLDLLEELLRHSQFSYERLDGSTSASSRSAAVERFHRPSANRFVMLLSTRAGGLGLNLTAADTVVIFDSDWNPQNDLQAMARAHRIGQTRAVRVYRLLTAKTYEMHMFHSASMKLGLDRAVLAHQRHEGEGDDKKKVKSEKETQAKEIDELLKKGAYDVFRDDDDKEAEMFMEGDIDQLLERSSRKVTYGKTVEGTMSARGLGSFSKASFVATTDDGDGTDVDLDDPDFWNKAIGLDAPPEPPLEGMDAEALEYEGKKRHRKQVQVFDPYAAFAEAEQKKKDKLAQKAKEEKEERERLRKEKKAKKIQDKERRKKEREQAKEARDSKVSSSSSSSHKKTLSSPTSSPSSGTHHTTHSSSFKKSSSSSSCSHSKKHLQNQRRQALRRAANEDPPLERLKQGWERPHRHRTIRATLRFGFGRFCKIRQEANLATLPIQDVEVFVRCCVYQWGLQAAIGVGELKRRGVGLKNLSGVDKVDTRWVVNAMVTSLKMYRQVVSDDVVLRLPACLVEMEFVEELRKGAALDALKRCAFLSRLNRVVEGALDRVLADLGHEELGKRGCPTKDLTTLDIDLKSRHVTTEELCHSLSSHITSPTPFRPPAPWWDRSCDLALIVGTFIHGLGNYDAMQSDDDLPFGYKISQYALIDEGCRKGYENWEACVKSVRRLVEESSTAGTTTASSKDAVKKDGGVDSGKDDEKVTLSKLSAVMTQAMRARRHVVNGDDGKVSVEVTDSVLPQHNLLPLPDAAILDHLLVKLIDNIERNSTEEAEGHDEIIDSMVKHEQDNQIPFAMPSNGDSIISIHTKYYNENAPSSSILKYALIGFNRRVNWNVNGKYDDRSSYIWGSATSPDFGTKLEDKRGHGVPLSVTRFGLTGLIHADKNTISRFVNAEKKKKEELKSARSSSSSDSQNDGEARTTTKAITSGETVNVLLPPFWKDHPAHRAKIILTLLRYGFPHSSKKDKINSGVWSALYSDDTATMLTNNGCTNTINHKSFLTYTQLLANINLDTTQTDESTTKTYITHCLLPHCLKLCLSPPPPIPKDAVTSSETAPLLSPLPDPAIPISQHSPLSIPIATALLRRQRLSKALRHILSGSHSPSDLLHFFHSPLLRKNLHGFPVWWCPWIHDFALVLSAATRGLFVVLSETEREYNEVFRREAVERHVRAVFWEGRDGMKPALPRCFLNTSQNGEVEEWVKRQAGLFPSEALVERRLAFICAELTKVEGGGVVEEKSWRFENVPMFDHGGWPVNEGYQSRNVPGMNKSLLRTVEDDAMDEEES